MSLPVPQHPSSDQTSALAGQMLALISQTTENLRQAQTVKQVCELVLDALDQIQDSSHVGIAILDPARKKLMVQALRPSSSNGTGLTLPIDEATIAYLCHGDGSATHHFTPEQIQQIARSFPSPENTQLFPLLAQRRLQGILWVTAADDAPLPASSLTLIRVLCDMTAATLVGTRAQQRLRDEQKKHQLQLLRGQQVSEGFRYILTILNSNRPLTEVLQYIISQACWLLDTTMGVAFRWHKNTNSLKMIVQHGLPSQRHHMLDTQAVYNAITLKQVAVSTLNAPGAEQTNTAGPPPEYTTSLVVPILLENEPYGCIALYFTEARTFTDEEINLALNFCEQAALAIENDRLRVEAEKQAVDTERNRLARELHDAITQNLFSSSLIAEVMPQLLVQNPDLATTKLAELRQLNQSALAEMRTLLLELRPQTFVEIELGTLLKQLQTAFSSRLQIPITLKLQHTPVVPPEVKVHIYRIAQEALNNTAKHARATSIQLSLSASTLPSGAGFALQIQDDGIGFDPRQTPPQCLGISIMKERAQAIHAQLDIDSTPGQGTRVRCQWTPSSSAATLLNSTKQAL
ncbi:MAG: GAF domain-containing sensor histidine kinase [Chloroflexi bacterium]|nr:GAF domain-containing sensor histidine kinase [Chloroflexota bacterium]